MGSLRTVILINKKYYSIHIYYYLNYEAVFSFFFQLSQKKWENKDSIYSWEKYPLVIFLQIWNEMFVEKKHLIVWNRSQFHFCFKFMVEIFINKVWPTNVNENYIYFNELSTFDPFYVGIFYLVYSNLFSLMVRYL